MDESTAREIAGLWHGGQSSPLYALSSTGYVSGDTLREVNELLDYAQDNSINERDWRDLVGLRLYVREQLGLV